MHGNIVNTYGADGLRASTGVAGQMPTDFLYDYDGSILAHQISGAYGPQEIWVNGRHFGFINLVGSPVSAVLTQSLTDWLGTERARADAAGNLQATFCNLPFGDQLTTCFGTDPNPADVTHFTGKERDNATDDVNGVNGLDYFGARHYSSSMGRFLSPDPISQNLLQIMNPQRWSKYAYALNSPLVMSDPTGKDAAAVNFSGMVADFGHEAIVSINPDGSAQFASFGPAQQDAVGLWGVGGEPGQVTLNAQPLPTIQFGADGMPTDASMDALKTALAQIEKVDPNTVRINYFKTTPQETANLNAWIAQQESLPNWYSALCIRGSRNCASFTAQGLVAGGAITQSQANGLSIIPNDEFYQLEMLAPENSDQYGNAKVTATATNCVTLPNGTQQCDTQ